MSVLFGGQKELEEVNFSLPKKMSMFSFILKRYSEGMCFFSDHNTWRIADIENLVWFNLKYFCLKSLSQKREEYRCVTNISMLLLGWYDVATWTTLELDNVDLNVETKLSLTTSIYGTLSNVETTLWIWPLKNMNKKNF